MAKTVQLHITDPCHENWDNMTPADKGRFCASCQKQVVDFTNMTDREIAVFFKKPSTGSLCGRFMSDQLNREMEIPKKRIPWVKYFFQFALPAFLISCRNNIVGKVAVRQEKQAELKTTPYQLLGDTTAVSYKVAPENPVVSCIIGDIAPEIVEGETMTAQPKKNEAVQDTITLPEVMVVVQGLTMGRIRVNENNCTIINPADTVMSIDTSEFVGKLGEISVVRYTEPIVKKDTIIGKMIEKVKAVFKPYPNPVRSNSTLNIEWSQEEAGEYVLQLLNQSGQLVFNKTMWVDKDAKVLNLQVPNVAAGSYFLRMINKKTGNPFTEKIIIQ